VTSNVRAPVDYGNKENPDGTCLVTAEAIAELVKIIEGLASQPSLMSLKDGFLETCFVMYEIRTVI